MSFDFLINSLIKNAEKQKDNIAYKFYGKNGDVVTATYGELYDTYLYYKEKTVSYKNSICGICLDYSKDLIGLLFSFLANGIVPVIIRYNDDFSKIENEIIKVIESVSPFAIFTSSGFKKSAFFEERNVKLININNIEHATVSFSEKDYSLIQLTSGTTKFPRGMCLTETSLYSSAVIGETDWGYDKESRVLSYLPFSHLFGIVTGFILPLYVGCTCIMVNPSYISKKDENLFDLIEKEKITNVSMIISAVERELSLNRAKNLPFMKRIIIGGERISPNTYADMQNKFKNYNFNPDYILNTYGLSECGLITTLKASEKDKRVRRNEDCDYLSVGPKGNQFYDISVIDEKNNILPDGERGRVIISSPAMAKKFFSNNTLKNVNFLKLNDKEYYFNGDIGFISDENVFICDREDDMIIYNGNKFLSQGIEFNLNDVAEKFEIKKLRFINLPDSVNRIICYFESDYENKEEIYEVIRKRVLTEFHIKIYDFCSVCADRNGSLLKLTKNNIIKSYNRNNIIDYDFEKYNPHCSKIGKTVGVLKKKNDEFFARTVFGDIPLNLQRNLISSPLAENDLYRFFISSGEVIKCEKAKTKKINSSFEKNGHKYELRHFYEVDENDFNIFYNDFLNNKALPFPSVFNKTYDEFIKAATDAKYMNNNNSLGFNSLFIYYDGNIAGCMDFCYALNDITRLYRGHSFGSIMPKYKNKKLATEVTEFIFEIARAYGYSKVRVLCDENNEQVKSVLKKFDFSVEGKIEKYDLTI